MMSGILIQVDLKSGAACQLNDPKKHHYVPQFLLREFANARGQLLVRGVDSRREYLANVADVGHRNWGHSIIRPGGFVDNNMLERRMAELEGAVSLTLREIASARSARIGPEARETLSWFIALQWYRNRYMVDALTGAVDRASPSDELTQAEKTSATLVVGAFSLLEAWSNRCNGIGAPKEQFNSIVSLLDQFEWRICKYRHDKLIASDNLVCLSGVAEGFEDKLEVPRVWAEHGVGVGFSICRRITVPLTPRLGLHLDRDSRPRHIDAERFNRLTVNNSREFLACSPTWPRSQPELDSAVQARLELQRALRPALE